MMLMETSPELVLEYWEPERGKLVIGNIRPQSALTIRGCTCYLSMCATQQMDQGRGPAPEAIAITYPSRQLTVHDITATIASYSPLRTFLRIYHPENFARQNIRSKSDKKGWSETEDISTKNVDNTFFTKDVQEQFVSDLQTFIAELGTPQERAPKKNYLLYGKPGTGKTSIVRVVLGKYKIFALNASVAADSMHVFEEAILEIKKYVAVGETYVVLIDEADKMEWDSYEVGKLCSFLDGIMPNSGRIVIMTANDISFFEEHPVLMRPGRIDKVIEMGEPDDYQLRKTIQLHRPDWKLPETELRTNLSIARVIEIIADPNSTMSQIIDEEGEIAKSEFDSPDPTQVSSECCSRPDEDLGVQVDTMLRKIQAGWDSFAAVALESANCHAANQFNNMLLADRTKVQECRFSQFGDCNHGWVVKSYCLTCIGTDIDDLTHEIVKVYNRSEPNSAIRLQIARFFHGRPNSALCHKKIPDYDLGSPDMSLPDEPGELISDRAHQSH